MPYIYELVDLEPELEFVTPENLTQTNVVLPISLHAKDIGSGFHLSDLIWAGLDNRTTVPNATTVEATLSNLTLINITSIWNFGNHTSNLTFREVWINTTLPTTEQWHDYVADIADLSGRHYLRLAFSQVRYNSSDFTCFRHPINYDDSLLISQFKQNGMQNLGTMERLSKPISNWKCDHTNQSR